MAVSGRRRFDDDRVVRYETAEKNFEVEVARTLNKWCVTVYHLLGLSIAVPRHTNLARPARSAEA